MIEDDRQGLVSGPICIVWIEVCNTFYCDYLLRRKMTAMSCTVGANNKSVEDGVAHWRTASLCCPYSTAHLNYPIVICDPNCYDPNHGTQIKHLTAVPVTRQIVLQQRGETVSTATRLDLPVACVCRTLRKSGLCRRTQHSRHARKVMT